MSANPVEGIAIVGMAGRFPGAASIDALWDNLIAGRESITRFAPEELSPWVPNAQRDHPNYVPARGVVADADRFDAAFFGIAPREALLMDPQQRIFLELCWNALEQAGIDAQRHAGSIGVYAGCSNNGYRRLLDACPDIAQTHGEFALMLGNEKDYIAPRVAHRLDLRGPALSIHTACSTSLVAVTQAWYALMSCQCDVALAGGITIQAPQEAGYIPLDGAIESADGHCRPFDADADGTVFSSGGGVVVLERCADALAAGHTIYAVIRGVGINNDGADKASFSAPSVRGQAAAIEMALACAGVEADSIDCIEAHGTATRLGDPIEVEALARAFRDDWRVDEPCWLGSIKGNIGHLVAAAGVAGLIKMALALHHERLPATLHFRKRNPQIDFAATPFRVATHPIEWPRGAKPRRAGVSSFGIGGTNAHVILEEAPPRAVRMPAASGAWPLVLSARDPAALQRRGAELAAALEKYTDADLADIAWTLASGRRTMAVRAVVIAATLEQARTALAQLQAHNAVVVATVDACAAQWAASATAWCNGADVDWTCTFATPRRCVPLPTYPFQGERYWPDMPLTVRAENTDAASTLVAAAQASSGPEALGRDAQAHAAPSASAAPKDAPRESDALAPRLVEALRDIIQHASGLALGAADDATCFLDLGLDSLVLVDVALELERRYACKLPFRRLLEDLDTIENLAAHLAPLGRDDAVGVGAAHANAASSIARAELPTCVALTDAQQEKWLGSQDDIEGFGADAAAVYNEALRIDLHGELDAEVLARSIEHLAVRHEMLAISVAPGGREQRYAPPSTLRLARRDFRAYGDPAAAVDDFCLQQAALPFDLARAPLLRATLLRTAADRHVLHVIGHHIAFDGWSARTLVADIAEMYTALRAGGTPTLPPAHSWRAYALAESAQRDSPAGQADLAWWSERYRDLPDALALPSDAGDAVDGALASTTVHAALGADLSARIDAAARRAGVTPFAFLLSAWLVLLQRLGGQCDLACGIPVARQAAHGIARMLGDGDNTLPLRIAIDPGERLDALLPRVQRELLDALEHPRVSVGMLGRHLSLLRRAGRARLVDAVFNLIPPIPAPRIEGVEAHVRECAKTATDMELACHIVVTAAGYAVELHHNRRRYSRRSVSGWLECYAQILDGMTCTLDRSVASVDLLGATRREAMLRGWNDTQREFDRTTALPALLSAQAASSPQSIAVECEAQSLRYAELDRRMHATAQGLAARGIGRGDLVGICMPRGIPMLIAVLGVLRSGAAYVPLDPTFPAERLRYMAEHARIGHIIVDGTAAPAFAFAPACTLVALGDLERARDGAIELPQVRGEDLAYVLYTSGSTGAPKGVRILHRNLVNFLGAMRERPGIDATCVLCAVTTLSFDIAGLELFAPLLAGGRVVIASDAEVHDTGLLAQRLRTSGTNLLQLTPSLLRALVQGAGVEAVRALKLLVGGEALPRDLADAVLRECAELWNMYGPTETTIWSTCARVTAGAAPIALGLPIANTRIYVLDALGAPQPPGVIGEIFIAGDGVADGYLHQPELSAQRFLRDPFAGDELARESARMYRTGDLGALREGMLYFHGRNDQQLKVRGYRIEPGEIEASAMRADAGIVEAAAVVREFGANDVRIVLHVAAGDAAPQLAQRLRAHLREHLPAYMLPQHIEVAASLPHTANGKIDRQALTRAAIAVVREPPIADPNQAWLGGLWRELIGDLDSVHGEDNFFDLGGHSLLAMEMAARVKRERGVRLSLLKIASSSLAALAADLPPASAADARTVGASRGVAEGVRA